MTKHRYSTRNSLVRLLKKSEPTIIGIDGWNGTGKSTLAEWLGEKIGFRVLKLDNFIIKPEVSGEYILDIKRIGACINDLLEKKEGIILEGVMLLDVLERLGISVYLVYLKLTHTKPSDLSDDVFFANLRQEPERLFEKFRDYYGDLPVQPMQKQLCVYYHKYMPIRQADVVFIQTKDDDSGDILAN